MGDMGQIQKAKGRILYSVGGWDEDVVEEMKGRVLPAPSPANTNAPECTDSSALQETSPARFRAVQV